MSLTPAEIFLSNEAQEILKNKYVIMIGDSVIRSMYKDLVKFLQTNDHLTDNQLKKKGEFNFQNDELLEGGQKGVMSNDISYTEVREYKTEFHLVKFYFITRCYSDYLMSICEDIKNDSEKPDLVIMNSGCWDLTRYGMNSIHEYKQNLPMGIFSLIRVLPSYTVFLWTTTMPISKDVKGGFMIPEVECLKSKLREDVLEANHYAYLIMKEFKLDVLDLHYFFRRQIQRRAKDGIHWDATAHRRITNLILNFLCDVWEMETPGRILVKKAPSLIVPADECGDEVDEPYEDEASNSPSHQNSESSNTNCTNTNNNNNNVNNNNNNSNTTNSKNPISTSSRSSSNSSIANRKSFNNNNNNNNNGNQEEESSKRPRISMSGSGFSASTTAIPSNPLNLTIGPQLNQATLLHQLQQIQQTQLNFLIQQTLINRPLVRSILPLIGNSTQIGNGLLATPNIQPQPTQPLMNIDVQQQYNSNNNNNNNKKRKFNALN